MLMRNLLYLLCCGIILAACGESNSKNEVTVSINEPEAVAHIPSEPDMTPEEVAAAFFDAGKAGDEELFASYMTAKARQDLASDPGSGISLSGDSVGEYTVDAATVDGDRALVPVMFMQSGTEQNGTLKMRLDNGPWRIYAISLTMAEGMEITINFEQMESMMQSFTESVGESLQEGMESIMASAFGDSEEDIQAHATKYTALEARSEAEYRATWINETDFSGMDAQKVLETLATRMALTVDVVGLEETLSASVEISLTGISNMDALERVCRLHDLYPIYPDIQDMSSGLAGAMVEALAAGLADMLDSNDAAISIEGVDGLQDAIDKKMSVDEEKNTEGQILLKSGKRPYPIAFVGPYLIEVLAVEENAPNPTGEVRVAARTFGLDAGVLTVQDLLYETIKIQSVSDSQGRSLANTDIRYLSNPEVKGTAAYDTVGVDLINMIREVTHIDLIAGGYDVLVPVQVYELEFASLEDGTQQSAGDLTVLLKSSGETSMFEISGPEALTENLKIMYLPIDEAGDPMAVQYDSTQFWMPGQSQSQLNTHEAPVKIRMKIIAGAVIKSYPFKLNDTPLTRYAEMPEKIQVLTFAGHDTPLSIVFKEITDRDPNFNKTLVHISNHSNKDAMSISAMFTYLDVDGTELKEFPHNMSGLYSSSGQLPIAVRGVEVDEETTAFFMPEETQDIRIRVDEVEFSDGSVWKAQP